MSREPDPVNQTLDIFTSDEPKGRLLQPGCAAQDRFPLNLDEVRVENVALPDLRDIASRLIIAGFASINRLSDFCCSRTSSAVVEAKSLSVVYIIL